MCQRTEALDKANERRYDWRDLKAAIYSGEITLHEALTDERAQRFPIHRLLDAQRQWGAARTKQTLAGLRIWPLNTISQLTERQIDRIVEMADSVRSEPKGWAARKAAPQPRPRKVIERLDDYKERLAAVCEEAHRRGWSTREPEDTQLQGVIVITPLGEAMMSVLEDLTFLAAELEAA
jgi:hypothetical protein